MNEIIPTQMIGETSTPPTGGTSERVGLRSGSVGKYATTHGSRDTGTEGYHVITMRMMNSRVLTLNMGPRTPAIDRAVSGSRGSPATASCVTRLCASASAARAGSESAAAEACAKSAAGAACGVRDEGMALREGASSRGTRGERTGGPARRRRLRGTRDEACGL